MISNLMSQYESSIQPRPIVRGGTRQLACSSRNTDSQGKEGWVCPIHGTKCGRQSTPDEYVESMLKINPVKVVCGFPLRIARYCRVKVLKCVEWFRPPSNVLSNVTTSDTFTPFLELQITFTPSKEKAVLYYFQALQMQKRLGVSVEHDRIDVMLLEGANINAKDEKGQTVLHDACREESLQTIVYLIEKGSAINTMDKQGRTPLHIAAAFDNYKIIGYLIKCKADYGALSLGDIQTPLHYAAKNDAPTSCKALIEHGANIEARDYRGRTPLLLAAELDRSVAASALLDSGASVKVLDYTGYHPICAMIKTMPAIAVKGLDQLYSVNKTTRQEIFYLNYLEPSLISNDGAKYPSPSVLEEIVQSENQDLIKHPVIKEMIHTKWSQFGIFAAVFDLTLYLVTLMLWSIMVSSVPYYTTNKQEAEKGFSEYIVEVLSAIFWIIQLVQEIMESYNGFQEHEEWKDWKLSQIRNDLQFCTTNDEREYLYDMEDEIKNTQSPYLSDFWNIYDWVFLVTSAVTFLLYLIDEFSSLSSQEWPLGFYKSVLLAISLITAWIRLFKYVKVYEWMGPFVVIITNTMSDVTKIAFVYFVLYIPASCVFYQFFGRSKIPAYSDGQLVAVFFTVFRMIVVDDYALDDMLEWGKEIGVDGWWVHFIISYWLMVSAIVLLNLFIALMSDTFQRIYDKAIEVAALEKAATIVDFEKRLSPPRREQFLKYIKKNFSPKIRYTEDEMHHSDALTEAKISPRALTRTIASQIDDLSDAMLSEKMEEAFEFEKDLVDTLEHQEATLKNLLEHLMPPAPRPEAT